MFFTYQYTIDTRDTDPFGQCRPSALLGILQEAATEAAVALKLSREEMLERYNCFWMLARIWYRLERPIYWNETVTIKTWHRGGKAASVYRDFDLYVGDDWVGEAVSTWVLADQDTHKLMRLSEVKEFEDTTGGDLCKDRRLGKLRLPEGMALAEERTLHYSDADINRHVNNSHYADVICDALHLERLGEGKFVSSLQVSYLAECFPGETLRIDTGEAEGLWYVHGSDREGMSRFDGTLGLTALPEEN
ncbi:acyl-[acyl-carrier-protein] thioesterase [Pseudoflavonifractor sp. MSJ-37]|uniref:acyl-[acyl-carrier-protein] thioesterase n=1 Tax=Pseudoflavonifractor sp. MSJ-37 TaxID=2841531 RepID=UPI00209E08F6|nr:acyl-ACP thioesterase domain-containing protein [Pseudoflavonifractor sp. MSJ-37]